MNIKPKLPFEENEMFEKCGLAGAILCLTYTFAKCWLAKAILCLQYIKIYMQEYDDDVRDYLYISGLRPIVLCGS